MLLYSPRHLASSFWHYSLRPLSLPFWGRGLIYPLGAWLIALLIVDNLTTSEDMTRLDNLIGTTNPLFEKVEKVFK